MRRVARLLVPVTLAVFAIPSQALAATRFSEASFVVHMGVSLVGLIVSVVLLVEALGLRKIALGGLIAEKMSRRSRAIGCCSANSWYTCCSTRSTRASISRCAE